ncbi:hypothetical protein, partial [Klebsiella pneumoniae]|uniref:hypothetical protein n=1 Tax=Klebsiella pneumoniae TaxID=573 RepID=UPI0025A2A8FB
SSMDVFVDGCQTVRAALIHVHYTRLVVWLNNSVHLHRDGGGVQWVVLGVRGVRGHRQVDEKGATRLTTVHVPLCERDGFVVGEKPELNMGAGQLLRLCRNEHECTCAEENCSMQKKG